MCDTKNTNTALSSIAQATEKAAEEARTPRPSCTTFAHVCVFIGTRVELLIPYVGNPRSEEKIPSLDPCWPSL